MREQFEAINRDVTRLSHNYFHPANPIPFVSELAVVGPLLRAEQRLLHDRVHASVAVDHPSSSD
jgi:hypothetical protein